MIFYDILPKSTSSTSNHSVWYLLFSNLHIHKVQILDSNCMQEHLHFFATNLVLSYFLDQYPGARRPRTQELPFNFLIFKIASLSQPFCELLIFSREIYSLTSSIRQLFFFPYNKHRDFFSFSRKVLFNEIPVLISVNISLRYNFLLAFK